MNCVLICGILSGVAALVAGSSIAWELLQQNGRILLRLEALEKQFEELKAASDKEKRESERNNEAEEEADAIRNAEECADRFRNRSLSNSKIKRDGLKAGTVAPDFRLPRLEGGELALSDLRGKFVILVFSSPHCGPCNTLAPKLQKFHRKHPELELVMISRESPDENRAKVKEQGLTFTVVLQKQWEVSRDYAIFATPVAYLIDRSGSISADVAVGVEVIVELLRRAKGMLRQDGRRGKRAWIKRAIGWPVSAASA
jgi:peroxiredoxin